MDGAAKHAFAWINEFVHTVHSRPVPWIFLPKISSIAFFKFFIIIQNTTYKFQFFCAIVTTYCSIITEWGKASSKERKIRKNLKC